MITEQDVVLDNLLISMHLGDWLGDIEEHEVKKNDVLHYMMEDFHVDKPLAEKLLEMHYLANQDLEPSWK